MIRIENKEIITTNIIAYIEILNGDISMKDRFASFPVRMYDEHNNLLFLNRVEIKDEEYDAWNSDDYIEDLILSKLEMVKNIEPEVTPEATPEATPEVTPEEPVITTDSSTSDSGSTSSTDAGI